MLTIPSAIFSALQAHGEAAYPNEGAGLLLGRDNGGDKTVVDILPLENRWNTEEQYHRYQITSQDALYGEKEAMRRGLDVVGFFHSHPDHPAEPSAFDREWATWSGYSYVITTIEKGRATASRSWLLREDRSAFDEEPIQISGQQSTT